MDKNKACPYCGQAYYIGGVKLNNEIEEQEYIINQCECEEAKVYQHNKRKIFKIGDILDDILNEKRDIHTTQIIDYKKNILDMAVMVNKEDFVNAIINIQMDDSMIKKISIYKSQKGLLTFTATNTAKTKYEV